MKRYSILDILNKTIIIVPLGYLIGLLGLFLLNNWRFFLWEKLLIKNAYLKTTI